MHKIAHCSKFTTLSAVSLFVSVHTFYCHVTHLRCCALEKDPVSFLYSIEDPHRPTSLKTPIITMSDVVVGDTASMASTNPLTEIYSFTIQLTKLKHE